MTAFLGYVLPYGQMSLWGWPYYYIKNKNLSEKRTDIENFDPIIIDFKNIDSLFMRLNKNFMSMFIGLVDGDGYIEIGSQKQYNKLSKFIPESTIRIRLVIRLHKRDEILISYLTKMLKVESISNLNSVNQIRLIFSKRDLVTVIIPLMKLYNLKFLSYNRKKQYDLLIHI
jgi:hypothetical protein